MGEGVLSGKHIGVYDLLCEIRKRPTMFINSPSIHMLSSFLDGYYAASANFGLTTGDEEFFVDFQHWLLTRYDKIKALNIGYYPNIILIIALFDEYRAFDEFFEHVEQYVAEKRLNNTK